MANGFGIYNYINGDLYEEDFVDNRKHGQGKVLFVVIKVISLVNGEMTCRMVMESIIKIFNQFIKEI